MQICSEVKFSRRFLENALRNTGYDNYTAIADIIDNSIEKKVDSKNVRVYIIKTTGSRGGSLSAIEIADDGSGMNLATLQEALVLGSNTGKSLGENYGYYGAGLKTAGFSIGRRITVITKMDGDSIYKGVFDLDSNADGPLPVTVFTRVEENSEDAVNFYNKIKGEHGTLVVIDKIDRGPQNVDQFRNTLKQRIRVIFNKFIEDGKVHFHLHSDIASGAKRKDRLVNEELTFFDTVGIKSGLGTVVVKDTSFRIKGADVRVRVLNVPYDDGLHDRNHTSKDADFLPRSQRASGFYIYRSNRMVGGWREGLDFDMIRKSSGCTTGIRVELFVDGRADTLLGCTFNKMVGEKELDRIDEDLKFRISEIVEPIVKEVIRRSRMRDNERVLTEREQLIKKAFETAASALNKNEELRMGLIQKGRNLHPGNSKPKNPNPKKQLHPCLHRNRTGAWTGGFQTVNEGSDANHVTFSLHDRRVTTLFNADHPYYREFIAKQEPSVIVDECLQIGAQSAALQKVGYFDDENTRQIIDEYLAAQSQALRSLYDPAGAEE